jgi:hypothetical protein
LSALRRSIRRAQARDKVVRNVATLVDTPEGGKDGRSSKAMNLDQATTVLEHAKNDQLHAYVVLSLMTGVRTEEARALCWSHVVAWVPEAKEWRPVTETGRRRQGAQGALPASAQASDQHGRDRHERHL